MLAALSKWLHRGRDACDHCDNVWWHDRHSGGYVTMATYTLIPHGQHKPGSPMIFFIFSYKTNLNPFICVFVPQSRYLLTPVAGIRTVLLHCYSGHYGLIFIFFFSSSHLSKVICSNDFEHSQTHAFWHKPSHKAAKTSSWTIMNNQSCFKLKLKHRLPSRVTLWWVISAPSQNDISNA